MSEFRRRLMKENLDPVLNCDTSIEIFTTSGTITIPDKAFAMDIFLVGGGGGGGAWDTWGYTRGLPGLGGTCFCKRRISLSDITSISLTCGSAGSRASSDTGSILSATAGGTTILTTNLENFSASGGLAGYNSYINEACTETIFPSGIATRHVSFISQVGYTTVDTRVMTQYGYEGSFRLGTKILLDRYWINKDGYWQDDKSLEYGTNAHTDNITYPNYVEIFDFGVPAFFEEGLPTFAAQGASCNNTQNRTTYGPIGSIIENSTDRFVMGNACGYGSGGFGGTYRGSALGYGGNGTSGAAVIRWYLKK